MNIYEIRKLGREYCQTEGSEHYKGSKVEPIDLIISLELAEGFCLGSIIKYAGRFPETRNTNDLKKIADYAHILCGIEMMEGNEFISLKPLKKECINCKHWNYPSPTHGMCTQNVFMVCNRDNMRFFLPKEATNEPEHPHNT